MVKVLLAALIGATVSMQAFATNSDDYTPEFKAYTSFSFGAPQAQSLGLHYGLRMDNDSREQAQSNRPRLAIMQVDFSGKSGFESARLYGMPLISPAVQMNATGETGVGEKILWFSGYVLLGGVIYGIHELSAKHDDPAPAPAAPPPPQNCCTFTLTGAANVANCCL